MKPDINSLAWRAAQQWAGANSTPPRFFSFRAKRRFDPNAVKGGATAVFVFGALIVDLKFDIPGWKGDIFANLRVVYQRPDGKWATPAVWPMERGVNDFSVGPIPVAINIPDGAWVGIVLENPGGVRTDIAVVRYQAPLPPPPPPEEQPEEEENMSVLVNTLKKVTISLEGNASENISSAAPIAGMPVTITMVEVRVIRVPGDGRVQVILNAAGTEIAEFWTEPGRDYYPVPVYPGVEIGAGELVRATARFEGEVNLRAKFRGYVRP